MSDSSAASTKAAAASAPSARRRGSDGSAELRALSADLSRLARGGLDDELPPPAAADSEEGLTSGASEGGGSSRRAGGASDAASLPPVASSGDESYKHAGLKAIDELHASLSNGLSSLLGTSSWPARWSWTEGAAPSSAAASAVRAAPAVAVLPPTQLSAEATEATMTTIDLGAPLPSQPAPPSPAGTVLGASFEQSFEQGGLLLEAVGRTAMCILSPQLYCPCPTPGAGVTLFAGDAWEEADDEDERVRSGALQAGETPTFERAFSAAGGQRRIDELEELSTAAAQAAIRARACMLHADRAGYDKTLEDVRAALSSCEASLAAEAPPSKPATGDSSHLVVLQQAVTEANARAAAVVASAIASFEAELTAAEADANAVACAAPTSRSDDARSWRGCEAVAAQALERLHNRGIRRVGEAAAVALKNMRDLAASVTDREARLPAGAGGAQPWPSSAADKAVFVAARAVALNASISLLVAAFSSGIDRIVQHTAHAGLEEPARRLRLQADTYQDALQSASQASALHLSRGLRNFTYVLPAAHLAVALERSMSGGGAQLDAGR